MRLMIGYGNPLRCDDGIGPYLAATLGDGWQILTSIQLTPELAEPISRAKQVVFLDAAHGDTPGEVVCRWVEPLPANGAFSHTVTPASLLASAQTLYGAAPVAVLVTVTGASFGFSTELSPEILAQMPQIIAQVKDTFGAFAGRAVQQGMHPK